MARDPEVTPDPLGKRALFWVPTSGVSTADADRSGPATALPLGKRALYSGRDPSPTPCAGRRTTPWRTVGPSRSNASAVRRYRALASSTW